MYCMYWWVNDLLDPQSLIVTEERTQEYLRKMAGDSEEVGTVAAEARVLIDRATEIERIASALSEQLATEERAAQQQELDEMPKGIHDLLFHEYNSWIEAQNMSLSAKNKDESKAAGVQLCIALNRFAAIVQTCKTLNYECPPTAQYKHLWNTVPAA